MAVVATGGVCAGGYAAGAFLSFTTRATRRRRSSRNHTPRCLLIHLFFFAHHALLDWSHTPSPFCRSPYPLACWLFLSRSPIIYPKSGIVHLCVSFSLSPSPIVRYCTSLSVENSFPYVPQVWNCTLLPVDHPIPFTHFFVQVCQ